MIVDGKQRRAGIPLQIRFPDDGELKKRVEERAKANNRSLNAEIMHLLELNLDPNTKVMKAEDIHDMILGDHNVTLADLEARLQKVEDHLGFGPKSAKGRKGK